MKFWLLGIASLALIGFGWYRTYQSKKMYLKQETYVKHLDKNLFFSKLGRSLPPWMEEQLQENFQDFAAITKEQVDATFAQIQKVLPTPYIVRYRILDGQLYRYFRSGEPVTLEDNSTERAIKTLMQWVSLPNLDCIISFYDGIRPNHVFFHTTAQAPLLISAKIKSTPYIVLIPDWRSLGEWWASDIKAIKKAWTPWEQKKAFAIWRGTCNREERKTLCRFSLAHPEIVDAKFNLPLNDPALTQEGLMGKNVPWEELLACKYQPYVDGYMTASPALQWRLLSNCVTFKPETNEIQWFTMAIKPYVHYVPLKSDLSDLLEKIDWAKGHDAECRQMAENAMQFALQNLMVEDVMLYFHAVLCRYGALCKMDPKVMKQDIASDPHWVNIQRRQALRKKANGAQMQGYCPDSSPGGGIISFSETSPVP